MNEKALERTSWLRTDERPSALLVLAVATIGIVGFGFAGALSAGSAGLTDAGHALQSVGSHLAQAAKIPATLSKRLHNVASPTSTSSNWGGYADTATGGTILEATGIWYVPTISCASVYPSINDNWVGIDGWGSGTVEQGGTYGYCTAAGAGPYYWTWWEFYPYNGIQSVSSAVSPGDLIQAYVLYNPHISVNGAYGVYTIVVDDISTPSASFSVVGDPSTCNVAGACENGPDTSVECISESLVGQGYYLPNYGTTTFYSCDAEVSGHFSGIGGLPSSAGATVYKVTTIGFNSGKVQQKVSGLGTFDYKKDYFTITWKRYQ